MAAEQQPTHNINQEIEPPRVGSFKEPKIKWKNSKARQNLYKELTGGNIPRDAKDSNGRFMVPLLKEIYNMHEEYKLYDPKKLSSRLSSLRTQYHECMMCDAMDIEAFDNYRQNHQPSLFFLHGYLERQVLEAQRLLKINLDPKKHDITSKMDLWDSKPEFYKSIFP
jgi:hypothetical protein